MMAATNDCHQQINDSELETSTPDNHMREHQASSLNFSPDDTDKTPT